MLRPPVETDARTGAVAHQHAAAHVAASRGGGVAPSHRMRGRETVQKPERDCRHHKQVHRGDAVRMVAQKRAPALRRWASPPCHVLGHARLPDIDAELEKFAINPRRSPQWIGKAHLADQLADLKRHLWSSPARPRFPAPVGSEPRPMPPNDSLWPDDRQRRSNIRKQSVEADQYHPVEDIKAQSLRRCPPQDDDPLSQDHVLSFKRRSRSE